MKIIVLGCGNAFSDKNFNQSFLLEDGKRKLLIDCGTRTPASIRNAGIDINSITDVYISHQHGDHCGGLEELAFIRYDWKNKPRKYDDYELDKQVNYAPYLYANKELMKDLWDHTLSGGLRSMEGFDAQLDTFFIPRPIEPNKSFQWQDWKISLIQQIHIMTGSIIMNTFGLFIEHFTDTSRPKLFFTTDAQYFQPEQVKVFYDRADIIFQDCECIGCDTVNKKMLFKSGVHANYGQLAGWKGVNAMKLDDKTKKKLWLSHYQDFVTGCEDGFGNACDWDALAQEDGFAGFVTVGQEFNI